MRFNSIRAKGIGPFKNEVSLDLDGLDGRIIAVCGPNGAGKSTFLELLPGAMFRQCPTRGSLASLATSRDAFLEVGLTNGAQYVIRHTVDAITGKGESSVLDKDARPVLESGKREFDGWAAAHLPTEEVLFASMFAPQGSGGFLDMRAGDRKAVLLRCLGIEHLEVLAERAREKRKEALQSLSVTETRMKDEYARGGDRLQLLALAEGAKTALAIAEQDLATARTALAAIHGDIESAKDSRRAYDAAWTKKGELGGQLSALIPKQEDLEARIANNRKLLARGDEVRAAVERAKGLAEQLAAIQLRELESRTLAERFAPELRTVRASMDAARAQLAAASARHAEAVKALEAKDAVASAAKLLPEKRGMVDGARAECERTGARILDLQAFHENWAQGRLEGLRDCLRAIRDGHASVGPKLAGKALENDDALVERAKANPSILASTQADHWRQKEALEILVGEVHALELQASRAQDLARAETDEASAARDTMAAERARVDGAARESVLMAEREKVTAEATELRAQLAALGAESQKLAEITKYAPALAQAEVRITELEPQLLALHVERKAISAELDGLVIPEPPSAPDAGPAEKAVLAGQARVKDATSASALADAAHARAVEAAERVDEFERQCGALADTVADWTKLADDLGRDGIQALEIDAAGPELSALANDLLHTCFGSRFTITIESSRLSADGKRTLEGCEVKVLDVEGGREAPAKTFSGGERVILGEAVSLAFSMLACRRSGLEGPSLVRDESGAALDPANARSYVAMLRRAADIVGASRVFFVSHSEEVQALADARINISSGTIGVEVCP